MQVVIKSCKAIPVMVGETLLAKKQHSLAKQLSVGLGLVAMALGCDGIYGPYQNKITAKNPQVTANHLMFNMNFYEAVLSGALCIADGELKHALAFIREHPAILKPLGAFSVAMAF